MGRGAWIALAGGEAEKILVVEDEEGARHSLGVVLRGEGFDVLEAADGRGAPERVAEEGVDLVIMDIVMPYRDGVETIVELRYKARSVPIIAISGARNSVYL